MSVAVVIPSYRTPDAWLDESVESVLAQKPDKCVLVLDDSFNVPKGRTIIDRPDLMVMQIPHSGVGAARNVGNRATSADLICVLDADDIMLPGRIATQAAYLESHPDVDVVSGQMDYIDADGKLIGQPRTRPFTGPHYLGMVPHGASMYRRSLWERVGGYPEEQRSGADWRFFVRCERASCTFAVLPDAFIQRRIHPGSHSFKRSRHLQHWWRKARGMHTDTGAERSGR